MPKPKVVVALLVALLALPEITNAAGQVCTITRSGGTLLIKPGKMDEFLGLVRNGLTNDAAEDAACMVAYGTKIIITDWGFASSTVRVLDGPYKGCVGDIAAEFYGGCH